MTLNSFLEHFAFILWKTVHIMDTVNMLDRLCSNLSFQENQKLQYSSQIFSAKGKIFNTIYKIILHNTFFSLKLLFNHIESLAS